MIGDGVAFGAPVAERKHGIDQIVPRTLIAQVDFQPVVKESKEVAFDRQSITLHYPSGKKVPTFDFGSATSIDLCF